MFNIPVLLLFSVYPLLPQDSLEGQLPKRDLGVDAFLATYPDYDGQGIRVAVLDTGIDPGHPFLQATPQGTRKIVDWYDATSDGRLDTSYTVSSESDDMIGLSGRKMLLGKWFQANRTYHMGRIDGDFLPGGLTSRIQSDRRADWQENKTSFEEAKARWAANRTEEGTTQTLLEKEISRRMESFQDPGPVWDVLVFQNEETWTVLVDNDQDGDFNEESGLHSFRETGEWATLGDESNLNYCVQVPGDGSLTMIYFDTNGHGTHVAGIIGAWEGEAGRMNGVAPGVEFVAIKIGDGKYGGATSGFSIAKALDYAVEAGCTVANISFGGPSFFADGKEPDAWIIDEARRRGLITVSSAGNEGPTLSTVGAPATARGAFSIAAAVWPDTQKVNYGSLNPTEPVLFDFSSRGPLPTGSLGVDFTAPGAALSSLPSWLGTKGENFNGTSMAAPQASGCVALLQCAANGEGLPHSPTRIYRAMRMGAQPLLGFDWVDQGHGAISMLPSLDALRTLQGIDEDDREYIISVSNPFGTGSGVYIRDLASMNPFETRVNMAPVFEEDASNAEKSSFLRTFRVECESGWVTGPDAFYTSAQGHSFNLRINPAELPEGLSGTRVFLWDVDKPISAGPDVVIPVTVVKPSIVATSSNKDWIRDFQIEPGELSRNYVRVPEGANYVKVKFTQSSKGRKEFRTGAGSVSGFLYEGNRQKRGRFFLDEWGNAEQVVPVEPGTVFEYTIASRWAVNQSADIKLEMEFIGLVAQSSEMVIPAGQGTGYLAVKSLLQSETVTASASLAGVAIPVFAEMEILPDPIRSTVMDGRGMFYGVMEWEQYLPSKSSVSLYTPYSIQTTEIREDLALEVYDYMDRLVERKIVYEWETDLGSMDAGNYRFRLTFPSLGQNALTARFAGSELRVANLHEGLSLFGDLDSAMEESGGLGRLRIPYRGARSIFARVPELDDLPSGQYYYGSVSFKSGEDTLLNLPLRIERPALGSSGSGVVEASAEVNTKAKEAETAYLASLANPETELGVLLEQSRSWQKASPDDPMATLSVLRSLGAASLSQYALQDAPGFLSEFPHYQKEFLEAAPAWNPAQN